MLSEKLSHMLQRISCSKYNGKSCNDFNIDENDAASSIKRVTFVDVNKGVDKDWFTFDPDRGRNGSVITHILTTEVDKNVVVGEKIENLYHHKACDNIMIINKDGNLHVIYFEVKCGATGYSFQFKSSQCFVRYIVDICNMIGGVNFKITEERFILLHAVPAIAKKPVSYASEIESIKKSKPDSPHKIYVSSATKTLNFSAIYA
ncbi:hypothetical protein M4C91_26110 [Klebsiella pneumoniae]|jgi:hypothetical protein|nr:hypothetical protein [Klebsiella pneumoniae]KAB0285777.1 hypothetical protein FPQ52_27005 [Klebsiella pneumoniae]MBW5672763.1 hypothetical protein [Klebsiella pneumoniae]MCB3748680.1 hypothetical protein [Klebsiella pneumoniae]MCM6376640.1 hypothetical protein [Klebsiella pneumoniae]MCM6462007.1 hypothetical protein [Klebsiella pneumoniae]